MANQNGSEPGDDGIDRRGFLKCMAWAGTGILYSVSGGLLHAGALNRLAGLGGDEGSPGLVRQGGSAGLRTSGADFSFAQISDSHMGFSKAANTDVAGTLKEAVAKITALLPAPDFVLHTGDISHLSKPGEFDAVDQILKSAGTGRVFFVPGEHDVLGDDGKEYRGRYGRDTQGGGWYSFDHKGCHFVGLVNVVNLKAGGLGSLGAPQLEWLGKDLRSLSSSTPVVVFAHIPLWTIYPDWGWGTDDSAQALALLRRFGSVTVLNGHIHQTMRKIEGNVTFHTATSTAFPQPQPGKAPSPGPMTVPADRLRSLLGVTQVTYARGRHSLAVIDSSLQDAGASGGQRIDIDNFAFQPAVLTVPAGTEVTWVNQDDVPHTVVSVDGRFKSRVMDTDERFTYRFAAPGTYPYFCSVHPLMTGRVIVSA